MNKKFPLKLYQPFLNQNEHLSIVYKIEGDKFYVLNHNGSIYTVYDGGNPNYKESIKTNEEFFNQFPLFRLRVEDKDKYLKIQSDFFSTIREEQNNKKLLLIL
jgi:hypothetical protein